jgi:ketosteroid isomerase-like protein
MLKKILLPCLAAAVTVSMPLSSWAAGNIPVLKPRAIPGLTAKKVSLSAADRLAIEKMIQNMVKATNAGDPDQYIKSYAPKYQGSVEGSEKISTYDELQQGKGLIGLFKSMGIRVKTENIVINSTGKNQATAEITYRAALTANSPLQDGRNRSSSNSWQVITGLEKINGRWLVVSEYTMKPLSNDAPQIANQPTSIRNITESDRQTFGAFFKRHVEALNRKDLNGYLATLDQQAPQFGKAKDEAIELFQAYNLRYTIKSVRVLSVGAKDAVVEMVATVKKISGGEFKDSTMITTNLLRKINGKWRIYDTQIDSLVSLQAQR